MFEQGGREPWSRLADRPQRAKVDAEEPVMSGLQHDLERDIGIGLARAEAEASAAESVIAMAESRVKVLAGSIARLRALAVQVELLRPDPIAPAPPIDELTRAKARRALARSGFVKVMP